MEIIARINPAYFAAIALFAAKNDVRYYLNAVFVEPHPERGAVIVATNGHIIGVLHDPEGFASKPIIVGDISKTLLSACAAKSGAIKGVRPTALYLSEGGAVVAYGEIQEGNIDPFGGNVTHLSRITPLEAKYPNYRDVIEKYTRNPTPEFPEIQSRYMAIFDKVMKIIGSSGYSGLQFESRGKDEALIARIMNGELDERFLSVLMPLRSDLRPNSILPLWLTKKAEPDLEKHNQPSSSSS